MSIFKKLGPGLLFAGAAIGVSHLVQSTRAGAEFGFGLIWALLLVNLFKYPFFKFAPQYAMATGESVLHGYKKLGTWVLWIYFILNIATMFTIQTAVTIVTAGLAANLFGITANPVIWSVIISIICVAILIIGKYKLLDTLMKIIVSTLTISTIVALCIAFFNTEEAQSWQQILPTDTASIAFLIAFMGWMPAPIDVSIWQSLWALEKNKDDKEYDAKSSMFDFNFGYIAATIIGLLFIGLGALIMFHSEEKFSANATQFAGQLINMYTTNLGKGTYFLIAIAAFTTMFSTTLTTTDASPRVMATTTELLLGRKQKHAYGIWVVILMLGTLSIFLFFLSEMKILVQIATVLSFVTAPFYAIANYKLITSKHTPENWRPNLVLKVLSIAGILFLIGFSIWYCSTFI
ncbi:Mn2+ and Fe2+ transporters of the NRAMP family [Pustulibacterium marinum]|uniref:Mn2+ and Fe2+ transporters of the NRAMP family n=1 Tax=Pustulibacterium marinum TaxID=1224947 RepID=A0A1I7HNV4_9FLAO|nr:Nramp family divalent metal transporter [Pustulibacterium marinum]SFU62343.1 Mn2+ and Fe2+ transporters of the NRAMP family [Pustulibacterium marinum]